jgi:hypothetical protein
MRQIAGGQRHRSVVDFGVRWRTGSVVVEEEEEEEEESRLAGLFGDLGRLWRAVIESLRYCGWLVGWLISFTLTPRSKSDIQDTTTF